MSKKEIKILAVLGILILAAVIAVAVVRTVNQPQTVINDFQAPAFDPSAVSGRPNAEDIQDLPYGTLNLAEGISVSLVSTVTVGADGTAEIWFTAPADNTAWVRLRLMDDQGNILGQTGLLRPGEYVRTMTLDTVPESGGVVMAKILTYEPETYYSLGSANAQVMLLPAD